MVVTYSNHLFGYTLQPICWCWSVVLTYIVYISKNVEAHSTVVFDGYGSVTFTKVVEKR